MEDELKQVDNKADLKEFAVKLGIDDKAKLKHLDYEAAGFILSLFKAIEERLAKLEAK